MKNLFLFAIAILGISMTVFSQVYMEAPYLDTTKAAINVFDMQGSFDSWASQHNLSEEKGWKQYKRWEMDLIHDVDENGHLLSARQRWYAYQKAMYGMPSLKSNPSWVSMNPNQIPSSYDSVNIVGMGRVNCITFHPTDSLVFWVGSSNGGVWKTTDGGANWIPLLDEAPTMRVSDIAIQQSNPDVMYLSTGDIDYIANSGGGEGTRNFGMGVLKSVDGGLTWDTTGLSFNLSEGYATLLRRVVVSKQDSAHLIAAGATGIYKSTDGGASWTKNDANVIIDLEVNPFNDSIIYASTFKISSIPGSSHKILKSTDFGSTWSVLPASIPSSAYRTELAISHSDTNILYALSAKSGFVSLMKTTNSGASWDLIATADSIPNLMGYWDGGVSGTFTDNAGNGWYDLAMEIDPNDPDKIYTGGVNVWASEDGGKNWEMVSFWRNLLGKSIHADQHQFKFHPLTGEFFSCNDGGLAKTNQLIPGDFTAMLPCFNMSNGNITPGCYQFPTQWENLSHGLHISEHYYIGQNDRMNADFSVGNQDNGTRIYRNQKWTFTYGADGGQPMLDFNDTSVVYSSTQYGSLYRSLDGGRSYSSNLTGSLSCNTFIPTLVMHPHNSNTLYAGFNNAYVSYDRGDNWSNLKNTTYNVQDLVIPEKYPYYIYIVDRRFLYVSVDSGDTWVRNYLPKNSNTHKIAVDFNNPDVVYVTYSGYGDTLKVFKSDDQGLTWSNLTKNLPNIPVNCISLQAGYQSDGDTISGIYIGTDYGIFYTNDSLLQTPDAWVRYGQGLPNVTIYDMAINYKAQKLRAATYGRGLWEVDLYEMSNGVNVDIQNEKVVASGLQVYPNPASHRLYVSMHNAQEEIQSVRIYDASARLVYTNNEVANSLGHSILIDQFNKGIYFVQVQTNVMTYTTKFVKQ
jgi:photosystem II stability/assembly factor-like uncharacterized protein